LTYGNLPSWLVENTLIKNALGALLVDSFIKSFGLIIGGYDGLKISNCGKLFIFTLFYILFDL